VFISREQNKTGLQRRGGFSTKDASIGDLPQAPRDTRAFTAELRSFALPLSIYFHAKTPKNTNAIILYSFLKPPFLIKSPAFYI